MLFIPVDCIDSKCLTKFQFGLGMVSPSPKVSFWFISLFIMCSVNSGGCNKLWVVGEILGLKGSLNLVES